jgi:exodeoxyribonuclease-3
MTRFVTWNVNSIKARLENVTSWFRAAKPDVAMLQEIKCTDAEFPREPFEELGYNIAICGQKTYNGVAVLSRHPMTEECRALPDGDGDSHARYMEALIEVPGRDRRTIVRVASIYLPNGNPAPGPKYDYKLAWIERLRAHAGERLALEETMVLAGDYNVIPTPQDVHDPKLWTKDALFLPPTRMAWHSLTNLGLTDAIRATSDDPGLYTFWDYQAGAFQKNNGIRIDHLLLSPQAADRLTAAGIDRAMRGGEQPSDHVPVWIELNV